MFLTLWVEKLVWKSRFKLRNVCSDCGHSNSTRLWPQSLLGRRFRRFDECQLAVKTTDDAMSRRSNKTLPSYGLKILVSVVRFAPGHHVPKQYQGLNFCLPKLCVRDSKTRQTHTFSRV